MNIGRIFAALCGMLLAVVLIFSVSTLAVLRGTVAEANDVRARAETVLEELRAELDKAEAIAVNAKPSAPPPAGNGDPRDPAAAETAGTAHVFVLRSYDGKIGVFTEEGYLIRTVDADLRLLPAADRAALEEGIRTTSWKELLARIEDYEP